MAILSPQVIWFTLRDHAYMSFKENEWVDFSDYKRVSLVTLPNGNNTNLLRVTHKTNKIGLMNLQGKVLMPAQYNDIEVVEGRLILVKTKGKTGLCDTTGRWLLQPKYDAAGAAFGGYINFLKNGKFGLYHARKGWVTKLSYDATLRPYGPDTSEWFVARRNNKYGVINSYEKIEIPFDFDEIKYWNTDTALVKFNEQWCMFSIAKKDTLGPVIDRFKLETAPDGRLYAIVFKDANLGLMGAHKGLILQPYFDEIMPMVVGDQMLWLTGKKDSRPGYYEVSYHSQAGALIRTETVSTQVYDQLFCDH